MEQELINFKENIDAWVKEIRRDVAKVSELPYILDENVDNIQHNYELIRELRAEIDVLKHELNALKIIQIATLKVNLRRKLPL